MIARAADGYYHPASEDQVVGLVQHARAEGLKIRVRGSAHSVEAAIYTGDFSAPPLAERHINIYMDRMTAVTFDDTRQQVTVQAGCHLGYDPADPAGQSTVENSLFYQLEQHGWAASWLPAPPAAASTTASAARSSPSAWSTASARSANSTRAMTWTTRSTGWAFPWDCWASSRPSPSSAWTATTSRASKSPPTMTSARSIYLAPAASAGPAWSSSSAR